VPSFSMMSTLPVEPTSFTKGVSVYKNGTKTTNGFQIDRSNDGALVLETKNPHEMDDCIVFNEDTHKYYFDGKLLETSCTALLSQFFEKFDTDLIISKMITGKN
jgi:hypothetical protein